MKRLLTFAVAMIVTVVSMAQTWLDVTEQYVKNPNFDENINGWVDDYRSAAQNHGFQGGFTEHVCALRVICPAELTVFISGKNKSKNDAAGNRIIVAKRRLHKLCPQIAEHDFLT